MENAGTNGFAVGGSDVRLLLADPHRLFGEAIKRLLESEGFEVVGICTTGKESLAAIDALRPNLVVVDEGLSDVSGVELGRQIIERNAEIRVLVIGSHTASNAAREAIQSGLHGFVTRQSTVNQLISSIAAISEGNVVMPPRTTDAVPASRSDKPRSGNELLVSQLTPREREVLLLLLKGASSKQIAKSLALRPNTVRTHVQNVLTKLQVHSRLEAAAVATSLGMGHELDQLSPAVRAERVPA